jgi:hypothetical protein
VTIESTPVSGIKRIYPHVNEVADWPAAQTIRLLWDRIHDLEERLQANQATITQLIEGHNANEAAVDVAAHDARQAMSIAQQGAVGESIPGGGGGGGGAGGGGGGGGGIILPGGGDGGGGAQGCAAAGQTGHDTGGLLTPVRAGQIICGTGNEFSALRNATATDAQRTANLNELILRMIWHLKQAGFQAGRQKNPSGAISPDKLCVIVDGVTRAYDVFFDASNFLAPLTTQMHETAPPVLVDDAGIPD